MVVIGEPKIKRLMDYLHEDFYPIDDHIHFVQVEKLFPGNHNLGFESIQTCYVNHCSEATGIALTHQDGWKICYSGDTAPCHRLVEIGHHCDILIHEATLEDGMEQSALSKKHSTTRQAIEIGKRMNAKHVILTHFSSRYPKIPNIHHLEANVSIAHDFMRITLQDLPYLSGAHEIVKTIFHEESNRLKRNQQKRKLIKW